MKIEDVKKVLILGSGTMGQQIGLLCALHGYDVVLYDISMDILEKAFRRMEKSAEQVAGSNQFSPEDATAALKRISLADTPEEASEDVDIVSESVPEDPRLKGAIFATFNALCKPETIFTTNTSSLVPSMFSEATGRPDRFCALHFHDVAISRIVDVMPHKGTSEETLETVRLFTENIGQIAIVMKREHNGYVFNNMLMAFLASSLALAAKGVASVEDIDRSWMGVMHTPVGPFGIMDSVGLETVWKITDYWANKRNDTQAIENAAFLKTYVDAGKIGIKSGEGFYTYPNPAFANTDFISTGK